MNKEYGGFRLGDRIRMIECKDPYAPVVGGEKGTVVLIDDLGTLHMKWDNGRTLGVCLGEDVVAHIPLSEEFRTFAASKVFDPTEEKAFSAHQEKALEAIGAMEEAAHESGGAWAVRSSCLDPANKGQTPEYFFVQAGELGNVIHGADIKNGIDVGFAKMGRAQSFIMIANGSGYESPKGNGIVQEAFECRLTTKAAALDFQERLDAGWSERGEAAQKLFFSPADQQSLSQAIANCKKIFAEHSKSHDLER